MTADYRIVGITVDAHSVVLEVLVAGLVHRLMVSPQGHVLVPGELALHYQRTELEAEAREVAAQARLGWVA